MKKHCHFSILCNELPFLKQKLPFLYKHFDQIIFYDLDIAKKSISSDGSNQYIRKFPDPEKKITLLQGMAPLRVVKKYHGQSLIEKQKMFAAGSRCVREDIDVFWCTDLDEFFKAELITEVEKQLRAHPKVTIINVPQIIFLKNFETALIDPSSPQPQRGVMLPSAPRIIRHKPGRVYGHCPALSGPQHQIWNHTIYHFSYIGLPRVLQKMIWRIKSRNYPQTLPAMRKYLTQKFLPYKGGVMAQAHPEARPGIRLYKVVTQPWSREQLPPYIDYVTLKRDLDHTNDAELKKEARRMFEIELK